MRRWFQNIFGGSPKRPEERASSPAVLQRIEELLRAPGRAHQTALVALASATPIDEFVSIVHCPSLVGSAIRDGELRKTSGPSQDVLTNSTFQFSSAQVSAFLERGAIEQTIFLLRREPNRADPRPANRFTIGRAKTNDIRIVDFAISRNHAIIESVSGEYRIHDCGSRNGTKVNGRLIRTDSEPLQDRDVVSLGRYEFSFLLPETLYEKLRSS